MTEHCVESECIAQKKAKPRIDVIIPTYHPDEKFKKLMYWLQRQTLPPQHIYIMNTEKQWFLEDAVQGFENVLCQCLD